MHKIIIISFVIAEEIRDMRQDFDPIPSMFETLLNPVPSLQAMSISDSSSEFIDLDPTDPNASLHSSNPELSFTSVTESCSINSDDEPLSSLQPPEREQPPTPLQKRRRRNKSS